MTEKTTASLLEALKLALAEPAEQRLYRSGKLAGLFGSRGGSAGEAASHALQTGLLEIVRTEVKGKTVTEWVRPTPRALEFVHSQESPVQALRDLQSLIQVNREAIPHWLAELQRELQTLQSRLTEEAQRWTHRLDTLGEQVAESLRRAEAAMGTLPASVTADAPWAENALAYLDHRAVAGAGKECPLPELFAAVREKVPDLSITSFHDRLRRLRDRHIVQLLPYPGPASAIPEPEYALLEGAQVFYLVAR